MYTNLTALYSNGSNPDILARDREVELLFLTFMRHEKPNALLVGEPGVGKTAVVHLAAYLIANELCPPALKGFQIIEVNTNALLAGPGYRGVTEQKFQEVIESSLKTGKTILFLDEFHTVEHLGEMANGQTPGLGNTLKPYLVRPDFRVVGATTTDEYASIKDKALLRRFFRIDVHEPSDEAVAWIIRVCLEKYGKGITFKKSVVEQILSLSKTMDGFNPDKSKDICDFLCSHAKLNNLKKIDDASVSKFFDKYFLMKSEGKKEKEAVFV